MISPKVNKAQLTLRFLLVLVSLLLASVFLILLTFKWNPFRSLTSKGSISGAAKKRVNNIKFGPAQSIKATAAASNETLSIPHTVLEGGSVNQGSNKAKKIIVSSQQAQLNLKNAELIFKKRYPGQPWEFEGFDGLRWTTLRGGSLGQYQNLAIADAAIQFLGDHPELMAGLPVGTELQVQSEKSSQTAHSEASVLQANYKGISLPGNIVVWRDKQGNIDNSANSVPALKQIAECDYISEEQALAALYQYTSEPILIINENQQGPHKIIKASAGLMGRVIWNIYFKYKNSKPTGKLYQNAQEIWQVLVDACTAEIVQVPRRSAEN